MKISTEKKHIDYTVRDFHFCSICADDKDMFMSNMAEANGLVESIKNSPEFGESLWKTILKQPNEISMIVFDSCDSTFLATCTIQKTDENPIKIGLDVCKDYRYKGLGGRILKELNTLAGQSFPGKDIIVEVRKSNYASRRMVEKCGGVLIESKDPLEVKTAAEILNRIVPDTDNETVDCYREIIEKGKNSLLVYRIPKY